MTKTKECRKKFGLSSSLRITDPYLLLGKGNGNPLSILAWKIPLMEETGRLQSMGSQRVGHKRPDSFLLFRDLRFPINLPKNRLSHTLYRLSHLILKETSEWFGLVWFL